MGKQKAFLLILAILLVDQISKIYVKTHFQLYENITVFSWFKIVFVENDGMAWGTKISDIIPALTDNSAKLLLSLFRIVAVIVIGFWLRKVINNQKPKILIFAISIIFAGALGNILDSVFYGIIFNDSYGQVATLFPETGGYAKLFYGSVVDMLNFPLYSGVLPEWLPFIGGKQFSFFDPVFNVADIAISTGIGILIIFNKKAFG